MYVTEYLFLGSLRHCLGRGEGLEKRRRDHIDALVGTLCRKHHGHQQLELCGEMQLRLGHRHRLLEIVNNLVISFL